jgi:hypothetical protein
MNKLPLLTVSYVNLKKYDLVLNINLFSLLVVLFRNHLFIHLKWRYMKRAFFRLTERKLFI